MLITIKKNQIISRNGNPIEEISTDLLQMEQMDHSLGMPVITTKKNKRILLKNSKQVIYNYTVKFDIWNHEYSEYMYEEVVPIQDDLLSDNLNLTDYQKENFKKLFNLKFNVSKIWRTSNLTVPVLEFTENHLILKYINSSDYGVFEFSSDFCSDYDYLNIFENLNHHDMIFFASYRLLKFLILGESISLDELKLMVDFSEKSSNFNLMGYIETDRLSIITLQTTTVYQKEVKFNPDFSSKKNSQTNFDNHFPINSQPFKQKIPDSKIIKEEVIKSQKVLKLREFEDNNAIDIEEEGMYHKSKRINKKRISETNMKINETVSSLKK